MSRVYTPTATHSATITMPADGDVINDANRKPAIESLADESLYLYNRVNPQHTSVGGHYAVGITGVSGSAKLTINCNAGEADNVAVVLISNPDSGYDAAITKRGDGQFVKADIGDASTGVVGGQAKIRSTGTTGDAASDLQLDIRNAAATTIFSVATDGTIATGMPAFTLSVSPGEFHPAIRAGGQTDTAAVYEVDEITYAGRMNVADANTRYIRCSEQRLQVGDVITAVTLHANRGGGGVGTVTAVLRDKNAYNTKQEAISGLTVNSGTGNQSDSTSTGTPHTVTDIKGYYWEISIANSTPTANEVSFEFLEFTVTRSKVR